MNYYTTLIFLTAATTLVMMTICLSNNVLDKQVRIGLIVTFLLIIAGTTCEYIGVSIAGKRFGNNSDLNIIIHWLARTLEFNILPFVPVIYARTLFSGLNVKSKLSKALIYLLCLSILVENTFMLLGIAFFIDENSLYHCEMFYNIYTYIISFIIAILYMFTKAYEFSEYYQRKNKIELIMMLLLVTACITIQILNPDILIIWISILIYIILIYLYYNNLMHWIDGLTGLLNQGGYKINISKKSKKTFSLIIFDVNNFKYINDNYGHDFGDIILQIVARTIKENYSNYGQCYRIGGDEFAVILEKNIENVEMLNNEFVKRLEEKRKDEARLPYVSYGYSVYDPIFKEVHDILDTKLEADHNMYICKSKNKLCDPTNPK